MALHEQSRSSLQETTPDLYDSLKDKLCPGCEKSIMSEEGDKVVAFGESFFHEACFKCSRCRGQIFVVDGATNPLLLSDGSLICSYCHYDCDACQLPLTDEAIVAGDNKYHPHCFQCKACAGNIEGLVFAKTSRGIYCMDCHNKRIAKYKENAQRKAEAEQTAAS